MSKSSMSKTNSELQSQAVLITGVGAPGTQGTIHCIKDLNMRLIGTDMNKEAPGAYFVDQFYLVPSPFAPDYLKIMLDICHSNQVSLVIPQTTNEIEVLSLHKKDFENQGVRVMVSDYDAIHTANNKYSLIEVFKELGFPVPKTILTSSRESLQDAVETLGYPKVPVAVKPPVSSGMRGFRILLPGAWDARRFFAEKPSGIELDLNQLVEILSTADQWPTILVSEYLPGDEFSVDAFIGKKTAAAIVRKRDKIRSGISFSTTPLPHPKMEKMTIEAGRFLGLQTVFGMQYKLDQRGIPKILECNPRVQGTMVASLSTGLNLIRAGALEALGTSVESFPHPQFGQSFNRYWGGIIINGGKAYVI